MVNQIYKLHKILQRKGFSTLFVSPVMESGKTQITKVDTHPDSAGSGILASNIASYLIHKNFIPQKHLVMQKKVWDVYTNQFNHE